MIVVYSKNNAHSAGDENYTESFPFSIESRYAGYNDSYSYFLVQCKQKGIKVAFTTSKDIIGSGIFESFWTYEKGWVKNKGKASSKVIFDKFTPSTLKQKDKLKLLTESKSVRLFNNKKLKSLFQNKLNTFENFKKWAIPSVEINNSNKQDIIKAKEKLDELLKNHKNNADFNENYILKDKMGAGGFKIYKINFKKFGLKKIIMHYEEDKKEVPLLSYVLQPFIECEKGFVFKKHNGLIDLRVILLNTKIVQTYIRIAKKGKFKCNEHQGGDLIYMPLNTIPQDVLVMVNKITKQLSTQVNLSHSLYALDFVRSNNGNLYFIEGNNNPGIDWNPDKKINEIKSKELINLIVNKLMLII